MIEELDYIRFTTCGADSMLAVEPAERWHNKRLKSSTYGAGRRLKEIWARPNARHAELQQFDVAFWKVQQFLLNFNRKGQRNLRLCRMGNSR
jgi:hypothetical protein